MSKAAMSAKMSNLIALSAAKRKAQKQKMDPNCNDIEMNMNESIEMKENRHISDSGDSKTNETIVSNDDIDILHENKIDIDNTRNSDTEQQTSEYRESSEDRNDSNAGETREFVGSV